MKNPHTTGGAPVRTKTGRIPFVRSVGVQANLAQQVPKRGLAVHTPAPRPPGNPTGELP